MEMLLLEPIWAGNNPFKNHHFFPKMLSRTKPSYLDFVGPWFRFETKRSMSICLHGDQRLVLVLRRQDNFVFTHLLDSVREANN